MTALDKSISEASSAQDTVAAIITPPGEGGIAAIRLAGPKSVQILKTVFWPRAETTPGEPTPFLMRFGKYVNRAGEQLDEILAVFMPEGKSYTGLDQVEIFCHGGRQVVKVILSDLLERGARAAEPGEFTKLAFLNGRIDLAKAEAVAELIAANTDSSYMTSRDHLLGRYTEHIETLRTSLISLLADIEATLDFPEEHLETTELSANLAKIARIESELEKLAASYQGGRIVREGYRVVLGGRPNAGKSSLFNLMLQQERALVHESAGTTRDYISEWIDLGGFAVNMIDTAGLRTDGAEVEKQGQEKAEQLMGSSDLVLWVVDLTSRNWMEHLQGDLASIKQKNHIVVGNKSDLLDSKVADRSGEMILLSCKTTAGLIDLEAAMIESVNRSMPDLTSGLVVTSARHQQKISAALESLSSAREKMGSPDQIELASYDVRESVRALEEITGRVYTEDILESIFASFCVGK